jgi:hypothetical protein
MSAARVHGRPRGGTGGPSAARLLDRLRDALRARLFLYREVLECELLDRHRFATQADARFAIFDFIEGWYNPRRRHSALDNLSPMMCEHTYATGKRSVASGSTITQGRRHLGYPLEGGAVRDMELRPQFTLHQTGATSGPSLSCQRATTRADA